MKVDICQVCRGWLFSNRQFREEDYLKRLMAFCGYYKISIRKITLIDRIYGKSSIDVCPDCFNEITEQLLKKKDLLEKIKGE